jgi:hypothetical protein
MCSALCADDTAIIASNRLLRRNLEAEEIIADGKSKTFAWNPGMERKFPASAQIRTSRLLLFSAG